MLIGYARVSTVKQDVRVQRSRLKDLGVEVDRIYFDRGLSGRTRERPGLNQALAAVREGDTLIVTKLDRLARSVRDAADIIATLSEKKVALSIDGVIYDPTQMAGKLMLNVLSLIAEFEADLISARTKEGLAIARAKGRKPGKRSRITAKQRAHIVEMWESGDYTQKEIGEMFSISDRSVRRVLNEEQATAPVPIGVYEGESKTT